MDRRRICSRFYRSVTRETMSQPYHILGSMSPERKNLNGRTHSANEFETPRSDIAFNDQPQGEPTAYMGLAFLRVCPDYKVSTEVLRPRAWDLASPRNSDTFQKLPETEPFLVTCIYSCAGPVQETGKLNTGHISYAFALGHIPLKLIWKTRNR